MNIGDFISSKLAGRLWHVTNEERLEMIKSDGFIRSEPNLSDGERWSTGMGQRWYPFVRHIGGFSLFDFPEGFCVEKYRIRCPSSSLEAFLPFPEKWGHGVWLEIDREQRRDSLLSGAAVWARCEREGEGRRCMPYIEAAHIGDMPVTSIRSRYLIGKGDADWQQLS